MVLSTSAQSGTHSNLSIHGQYPTPPLFTHTPRRGTIPDCRLFLLLPFLVSSDLSAAAQERQPRTKHGGTTTILDLTLSRRQEGLHGSQEPQPCVNKESRLHPALYSTKAQGAAGSLATLLSLQSCFPDGRRQSLEGSQRPRARPSEPSEDKEGANHQVPGPHWPHPLHFNPPGLGLDHEGVAPVLLL